MFRNAKVGDRVWYIAKGWGIIKEIHLEDEFEESISDKKITKEEFFEAYKNVFFGGID